MDWRRNKKNITLHRLTSFWNKEVWLLRSVCGDRLGTAPRLYGTGTIGEAPCAVRNGGFADPNTTRILRPVFAILLWWREFWCLVVFDGVAR